MSDICGSIGKVMFPFLSSKSDRDTVKSTMRGAVRASSYILIPMVLGLIAVADNFVLVLFTDKWADSIVYMRVLATVYITRPISTILQNGLLSVGESKSNLIHEFICAVLSLFLIFLAAFVYKSALVVAFSYVVVMIVGLFIRIYYSTKYLDYSFFEVMRDYLFKGIRVDNHEWVEGYYVKAQKLNGDGYEYFIIEEAADGNRGGVFRRRILRRSA
jgi:O-antigen/teichoic acid export membrane protein